MLRRDLGQGSPLESVLRLTPQKLSRSSQDEIASHGQTKHQALPRNRTTITSKAHQMVQVSTVATFFPADWAPNSPAAMTSKNRMTWTSDKMNRKGRQVSSARTDRTCSRSKRRYAPPADVPRPLDTRTAASA